MTRPSGFVPKPHAGQRAMFYPGGGLPAVRAIVDFVWQDTCVDLKPADPHNGLSAQAFRSVTVVPVGVMPPSGYYCTLASLEDCSFDFGEGGKRFEPAVELVRVNAAETATEGAPAPVTAAIKGYRQLSSADQALINECKELAERCGAMVARLRAMQPSPPTGPVPASPGMEDPFGQRSTIDQRWVSIGATHLQEGWMAIVRGIAQPSNF